MDRQRPDIAEEFAEINPEARQVLTLFGTSDATAAANLLLRYAAAVRRAYTSAYRILKDVQGDRFNRKPAGLSPETHTGSSGQPQQNRCRNRSICERSGRRRAAGNPHRTSSARALHSAGPHGRKHEITKRTQGRRCHRRWGPPRHNRNSESSKRKLRNPATERKRTTRTQYKPVAAA
jgi:hypothetical protein